MAAETLTLVTANLLSPHTERVRRHVPKQSERLAQIVADIRSFGICANIVQVCEAESEGQLSDLAGALELEVAVSHQQHDVGPRSKNPGGNNEFIATLVSPELSVGCAADVIELEPDGGRFATEIAYGNVALIGAHYPWQIRAGRRRLAISEALIERVAEFGNAVVCGDFNSWPVHAARRVFAPAGYYSAVSEISRKEMGFPVHYRESQLPLGLGRYLPQMKLDDILIRGDNLLFTESLARQSATDHPLLLAKILIRNSIARTLEAGTKRD